MSTPTPQLIWEGSTPYVGGSSMRIRLVRVHRSSGNDLGPPTEVEVCVSTTALNEPLWRRPVECEMESALGGIGDAFAEHLDKARRLRVVPSK